MHLLRVDTMGRAQLLHTLAHFGYEMSDLLKSTAIAGLVFMTIGIRDFNQQSGRTTTFPTRAPILQYNGTFQMPDGTVVDGSLDSPTLWEVLYYLRRADVPLAFFAQNFLRRITCHHRFDHPAEEVIPAAMAFAAIRNTGLSLKEILNRVKITGEDQGSCSGLGRCLEGLEESALDERLKTLLKGSLLAHGKASWPNFQRFLREWDHLHSLFVDIGLLTENELIECAPVMRLPTELEEILGLYGVILASLRRGSEPLLSKEEVVRLINKCFSGLDEGLDELAE